MAIYDKYSGLAYLDTLSFKKTLVHSLDPRIKLVVTFFFIIVAASFSKYELTGIVPLFLFPVVILSLADLPVLLILKQVLSIAPFAIVLGIANPLFDTEALFHIGGIGVSGGWISFASLMLRFLLTVSATLILVATSSFPGICFALEKLRVPRLMILQLLFLYRFIFVLTDEALRMVRARDMRSFKGSGTGVRVFRPLVGTLFIRTLDRAQRINQSMFSRSFKGLFYLPRNSRIGLSDLIFLVSWPAFFLICRYWNMSELIGNGLIRLTN